jgi:hypothetical protein
MISIDLKIFLKILSPNAVTIGEKEGLGLQYVNLEEKTQFNP